VVAEIKDSQRKREKIENNNNNNNVFVATAFCELFLYY